MLKAILRVLAMVLLVGVMGALVYGLHVVGQPAYDPMLNVAFIGTNNDADCIVIWQRDFAMMIDTGEDRDADAILAFLEENSIRELDYLVLTHPDKDHIGSAADITQAVRVHTVIQPYYRKENDPNRYLQARLAQGQVRIIEPSRVLHYIVNDLDIYVYPPRGKKYTDDNNYSLAIYIRHRDVSMLFPGDAEDRRLAELMQLELGVVDLYKLPHHGRYGDNSILYFSSLQPANVVVTAQRASQRMTAVGDKMGVRWFYTVENTVVFQSNGNSVQVMQNAG